MATPAVLGTLSGLSLRAPLFLCWRASTPRSVSLRLTLRRLCPAPLTRGSMGTVWLNSWRVRAFGSDSIPVCDLVEVEERLVCC